jgi:hypothetical protein
LLLEKISSRLARLRVKVRQATDGRLVVLDALILLRGCRCVPQRGNTAKTLFDLELFAILPWQLCAVQIEPTVVQITHE